MRTQGDGLSGILNEEVSRDHLLGDQLECAMLEVFVGDVAVVQECDVRIGGLDLLHKREGQCCEPKHAEPAGMRPASRIAGRDVSGSAGRAPEGAGTGRGLNVADDLRKRGRSGLTFIPSLGVGPDEHGSNPACHLLRAIFRGLACPAHEAKISRRRQPKAGRRDLLIQITPTRGR